MFFFAGTTTWRPRSYSFPKTRGAVSKQRHEKEEEEEEEEESQSFGEKEAESAEIEAEDESEQQAKLEPGEQDESAVTEENADMFRWYTVSVNSRNKVLDLKLLTPYLKVISHGGKPDLRSVVVVVVVVYPVITTVLLIILTCLFSVFKCCRCI